MRYAVLSMVGNYVSGAISREHFEDWFIPATWDVRIDPETQKLVNRIKLRLAEFLNGDWTEPELKEELSKLTPAATFGTGIIWSGAVGFTTTSTSDQGVSTGATFMVPLTGWVAAGQTVTLDLIQPASA